MPLAFHFATEVALPAQSGVTNFYPTVDMADAYAIQLPLDATHDPGVLARFIFSHQPSWIKQLTNVRDVIVAGFGLKTAKHLGRLASDPHAGRLGIFKIYGTSETEIIVGEDDTHLDFKVSVLCSRDSAANGYTLILSTVVHCHNRLGRVYLFVIAPFHRMVVKSSLRRAARIGWPTHS